MTGIRKDLTVEKGATWAHAFRPKLNDIDAATAGATAMMRIRPRLDSVELLHELTVANGRLSIAAGVISLGIAAEESQAWTWNRAWYTLVLAIPTVPALRVAYGRIRVTR